MSNENFVAIIPARENSSRVPRKNLRSFPKISLTSHKIQQALSVDSIDKVILTTDSIELIQESKIIKNKKLNLVHRPSSLATSTSNTLDAVKHALNTIGITEDQYKKWTIILLQPTSPLFSGVHIESALNQYRSDRDKDKVGLFSVERLPGKFQGEKHYYYDPVDNKLSEAYVKSVSQRVCSPSEYLVSRNGCSIYILKAQYLEGGFFQAGMKGYLVNSALSVDIDTEYDFVQAQLIYDYLQENQLDLFHPFKDF